MMNNSKLDAYDVKILDALQTDAELSVAALAETIGLSHTPCWRRVKALKEAGFIQHSVYLLDPQKLGIGVSVFVEISMERHDPKSLEAFEQAVQGLPNILECYSISGDRDYIVRVSVESIEMYEGFLKSKLLSLPNIASVNSRFTMKKVKYTTAVPLRSF